MMLIITALGSTIDAIHIVQQESPVVRSTKGIKFDCNCIQFGIGFGLVLLRGFSRPVLVVI